VASGPQLSVNHPEIAQSDALMILMCDEGCQSSLAAATSAPAVHPNVTALTASLCHRCDSHRLGPGASGTYEPIEQFKREAYL
jgi:hypothetical protein